MEPKVLVSDKFVIIVVPAAVGIALVPNTENQCDELFLLFHNIVAPETSIHEGKTPMFQFAKPTERHIVKVEDQVVLLVLDDVDFEERFAIIVLLIYEAEVRTDTPE